MQQQKKTTKVLINDQIRSPKVRLVHDDNVIGIVTLEEALKYADQKDLDLVQMNEDKTPVCKVFDYGKHKYELQKRQKEQNEKRRKQMLHKEITMRPVIGEHDFEIKLKHIKEFLADDIPVQVTVQFRNREMTTCLELGKGLLNKVVESVKSDKVTTTEISQNGRDMTVHVKPKTV